MTDRDLSDRDWIDDRLDIGSELLYLTQEECRDLGFTTEDFLSLAEDALVAHANENYEMPAKIGIHPLSEAFFHAMPAHVEPKDAAGMKWVECFPDNPDRFDLPQTSGLLIMNDEHSGFPLAIMDATWLTAMRTPAVSTLTAETVHPSAESFGMIGCGVQGRKHVRFMPERLEDLEDVYVYDVDPDTMDALVDDLQADVEPRIHRSESAQDAVANADVVCSATKITREPRSVVDSDVVEPGQTILPLDLNSFWDPELPRSAETYAVDSIAEHELFAEDGYFPDGLPEIDVETGEAIAGHCEARSSPSDVVVVSNIGMAVVDVVVGRELMDRALESGTGRRLPL
jgi:ornithine cyclodeaminase/alanine dehydrogenase